MIGCCIAFFLTLRGVKPILIERSVIAGAASSKAGGFLARHWCDGTSREKLAQVVRSIIKLICLFNIIMAPRLDLICIVSLPRI